MSIRRLTRAGFTLAELLVVIAIIGVLIGLLLPAVQAARESSRRSRCANNLKQLGLGILNYASAKTTLPPAALVDGLCSDPAAYSTKIGPNWAVLVLPFVEQSTLYDASGSGIQTYIKNAATGAIAGSETWVTANGTANSIVSQPVEIMLCPSDVGSGNKWTQTSSPGGTGIPWARGNYGANAGPGYYRASIAPAAFLRSGAGVAGDPYVYTEQISGSNGYGGLGLSGTSFSIGWVMGVNSRVRERNITDGTSKTVLLNELRISGGDLRGTWALGVPGASIIAASGRNDSPGPNISLSGWDDVQNCSDDPQNGMGCSNQAGSGQVTAKSRHPGGVQAVLCDGSVVWVGDSISQRNYYRIHCPNDGLGGGDRYE